MLRDGWAVGLFRVVFDEPAGPPCALAKVLNYNHLQDLNLFEAIVELFGGLFVSQYEATANSW